ncbi:MAG: hypothetical protein E6R05_00255, partial [Candidatus Moraniibacteriota bacterium]
LQTLLSINGFGRLGCAVFNIALETPAFEIVAINDLTEPEILAHLLARDTAYGHYRKSIEVRDKRWAKISGSVKSLIATISSSGFSSAILKAARPIRPKPLIAIRVFEVVI